MRPWLFLLGVLVVLVPEILRVYYIMPSAPMLHAHRRFSFVWGYGHMVIFAAIVATGAGLHVAAYFIEGKAHISSVATVLTVAVPVSAYILSIYALYSYLVSRLDPLHGWLLAATAIVVLASVAAAFATARDTPNMALAPNLPFVPVPSRAIIAASISAWFIASMPVSFCAITRCTFATAFRTPLPR